MYLTTPVVYNKVNFYGETLVIQDLCWFSLTTLVIRKYLSFFSYNTWYLRIFSRISQTTYVI